MSRQVPSFHHKTSNFECLRRDRVELVNVLSQKLDLTDAKSDFPDRPVSGEAGEGLIGMGLFLPVSRRFVR